MFLVGIVFHHFLLLSSTSLSGYASLLIHSSAEGHLDCFQFLALPQTAAVEFCRQF